MTNTILLTATRPLIDGNLVLLILIYLIAFAITYYFLKYTIKKAINESDLSKELKKVNELLEKIKFEEQVK